MNRPSGGRWEKIGEDRGQTLSSKSCPNLSRVRAVTMRKKTEVGQVTKIG
jgi:hypothetical protein